MLCEIPKRKHYANFLCSVALWFPAHPANQARLQVAMDEKFDPDPARDFEELPSGLMADEATEATHEFPPQDRSVLCAARPLYHRFKRWLALIVGTAKHAGVADG